MGSNDDLPPLGRSVRHAERYDPSQLHAIERARGREALGLPDEPPPFLGEDLWTAYELSWLDRQGRPRIACGEFRFRASSPSIVESKSLKLYLNSLNQTVFEDTETVREVIEQDLSRACGEQVLVSLHEPAQWAEKLTPATPAGECIDDLDLRIEHYAPEPALLAADSGRIVEETLFSRLFRSRCPVTGQPDWATVAVAYRGPAMDRAGLLGYLVSHRENEEFHEQCVERIFLDLQRRCGPQALTVAARFLRRGGLDINPVRESAGAPALSSQRTFRQ